MQQKQLYAVNEAINNIATNKTIDGKICNKAYQHAGSSSSAGQEWPEMCGEQQDNSSSQAGATATGFEKLWESGGSTTSVKGGGYDKAGTKLVGEKTSAKISKDMTGTTLTRDEKGVVSSAFAKAHEGAEIVAK